MDLSKGLCNGYDVYMMVSGWNSMDDVIRVEIEWLTTGSMQI